MSATTEDAGDEIPPTPEEIAAAGARSDLRFEEGELLAAQRQRDQILATVPRPLNGDAVKIANANDVVDAACARTSEARGRYHRTMRALVASRSRS